MEATGHTESLISCTALTLSCITASGTSEIFLSFKYVRTISLSQSSFKLQRVSSQKKNLDHVYNNPYPANVEYRMSS